MKAEQKRTINSSHLTQKIEFLFLKLSSILVLASLIPTGLALFGFLASRPLLQSFNPEFPTMNLETIIGTVVLSLSRLLINFDSLKTPENKRSQFSKHARSGLYFLSAMYVFTLGFYAQFYLGGLKDSQEVSSFFSSIRTSVSFLALLTSVYLCSSVPRFKNWALVFLIIPYYVALIALTGYIIQASTFYVETEGIGMAIPTSLAIILLVFSIALGPARHIGFGVFLSPSFGGQLLRRLLPISLLLPPLFTWFNLLMKRGGFYTAEMSTILQVVVPCFLLTTIIAWMAYRLTLSERELRLRKQEQEALTTLNQAKDEFLSILSHELRTPMNSILGFLELLPEYHPTSTSYGDYLNIIQRNANSQMRLIERILEVSRIVSDKMILDIRSFDFRKLVEEVFISFQTTFSDKKIEPEVVIDEDSLMYAGDEERIRQILWNLLSNAAKFTPEGGLVRVHLRQEANYLNVSVEDNGIGMDQGQMARIFESFWQADCSHTREFGGLGIGLTLAFKLAKAHEGYIVAESDGLGKGSKFTLVLPLNFSTSSKTN